MEQRIVSKVNDHQMKFKSDLIEWLNKFEGKVVCGDTDDTAAFLHYVNQYENPTFTDDEFQKRKRTTIWIPLNERCIARRSNKQQCSRRRRGGEFCCGTHVKGTPYGVVSQSAEEKNALKKVEIRTVEIGGIYYYADHENNVYSPEDIVAESTTPNIIGKYENDCFVAF